MAAMTQQQALRSLWRGLCSVYVREPDPAPDPATGRNTYTERAVAEEMPCRLSFSRITETQPDNGAARVAQTVKLFLDPAVELPPGSKLIVTQNGVTGYYTQSGEPAIYTHHKEVPLALFERWA